MSDNLEAYKIENNEQPKKFSKEIYKKWFKAGSNSGFLSITPSLAIGKWTIDIGSVDPNSNEVKSNTKCYVNPVQFNTYLRSVVAGTAKDLYPKRSQCPSPESYVSFGGSNNLSRVFKVHYWGAGPDKEGTPGGFAWKTGLFGGKTTSTGAIEPDWSDRKSADMIKVSLLEMNEIAYVLDIELRSYAARNQEWYAPE